MTWYVVLYTHNKFANQIYTSRRRPSHLWLWVSGCDGGYGYTGRTYIGTYNRVVTYFAELILLQFAQSWNVNQFEFKIYNGRCGWYSPSRGCSGRGHSFTSPGCTSGYAFEITTQFEWQKRINIHREFKSLYYNYIPRIASFDRLQDQLHDSLRHNHPLNINIAICIHRDCTSTFTRLLWVFGVTGRKSL